MRLLVQLLLCCTLFLSVGVLNAGQCGSCNAGEKCAPSCDKCCGTMGGVQYCDSSAGRLVCNNGFYSSCYCTRHAVMDLQHIQGCCLWQGGVLTVDGHTGAVVCNNGAVSEVCSQALPPQSIATW